MTTIEPNNKNLQQAIIDSLAPAALPDMSGADIDKLLNDVVAKPLSDEAAARILKQTNPAHPSDRTVRLPRGIHSPGDRPGSSKEIAMSMSNPDRSKHRGGINRGSVAALVVSAVCLLVVLIVTTRPRGQQRIVEKTGEIGSFTENMKDVWRNQPLVPQLASAVKTAARVAIGEVVETGDRERRRFSLPDGSVLFMNENTTVKLESLRQLSVTDGEVFVEVCPKFDDEDKREFFYVNTPNRKVTAVGTKFAVKATENNTDVLVTQGKVNIDGVTETVTAGRFVRFNKSDVKLSMAPRASEALNWTEDLMVAAPIVPRSEYCGGALISVDPNGQETRLSMRKYHVDVHIEDGFARTTIDQTYFNHMSSRLEGTFKFPLPADASLSRLAMYVGPKLMEGGMAERQHARNTFEQIVHRQKDPALLEWVDGTTFKMRVFPLEPRQEKRLVISYSQRLNTAYGKTHYRFPAGHNLDTVRDWSTTIRVKDGADLAYKSPSHAMEAQKVAGDLVLTAAVKNALFDRDVVLEIQDNWATTVEPKALASGIGTKNQTAAGNHIGSQPSSGDPAADGVSTNVDGLASKPEASAFGSIGKSRFTCTVHEDHQYLMLRHRPELKSDVKKQNRDWVFLFETSGDRNPVLARAQIEIIRTLLKNAEHEDTFNIVTAGTRPKTFRDSGIACDAKNINDAIAWLEKSHLIGALDFEQGLKTCVNLLEPQALASGFEAKIDSKNEQQVGSTTNDNDLTTSESATNRRSNDDDVLAPRPEASAYGSIGGGDRERFLVHVGSGLPILGQTSEKELVKTIPQSIRYVGVGVGKRWSRQFMKMAASRTGGYFTQINPDEKVNWRAFELLSVLNAPRLLNVNVIDNAEKLSFLCYTGSIAHGEEICSVTRLPKGAELPKSLVIAGELNGKTWRQSVAVENVIDKADYLPRSWARLEIDRLIADGADKHKDDIVTLSKAMYVMSPFTSLLVLENEAMYAQYNIDRGRKDHWALYPAPDTIKVVHEPVQRGFAKRQAKPKSVLDTVLARNASPVFSSAGFQGLVGRYNELMNQRRYEEAVVVAKHAMALEPELAASIVMVEKAKFAQHISQNSRNLRADGELSALTSVEVSQVPTSGDIGFPNNWANFSANTAAARNSVRIDFDFSVADTESTLNGRARRLSFDLEPIHLPSQFEIEELLHEEFGENVRRRSERQVDGKNIAARLRTQLRSLRELRKNVLSHGEKVVAGDQSLEARRMENRALETRLRHQVDQLIAGEFAPGEFLDQARYGFLPGGPLVSPEELIREELGVEQSRGLDSGIMRQMHQLISDGTEITKGERALHRFVQPVPVDTLSFGVDSDAVEGFEQHTHFYARPPLGLADLRPVNQLGLLVRPGPVRFEDTSRRWDVQGNMNELRFGNQLPEPEVGFFYAMGNLYRRPVRSMQTIDSLYDGAHETRIFVEHINTNFLGDLIAHAPGMNSTRADLLAVVAAKSNDQPKRGKVDESARKLIEKVRGLGWETVTLGSDKGTVQVHVNGAGQFAWDRTVSEGLGEQVLCDGEHLWHLYDEIGLGSKREYSRFHRGMIRTVAPWLVAPVDELSIGADVIAIDDRTVAIVPLSQSKIEPQALASGVEAMAGATNEKQVGSQRSDVDSAKDVESNDDDSSAPKPEASAYGSGGVQVRLVFAKDGRLIERHVVRVQDGETKTLVRVRFNRKGQITVFDGEGQQIAKTLRRRTPGTQPFGGLQIERKDLVILPLPYRDASTIFADVGPHAEQHHGHDGDYSNWPEENALALLATDAINQNRQRLAQVVMSRFFTKGDTRAGLYVLIANANPMRTVSPAKDGNPTVQKLILNYQPNDKVSDQHKALIRFARHLATASTDNEFNPSELLPQIEPQALASGVGARTGATNEKQVGSQKPDVDSATDVDSDDVNSLALRPEASAYGSNGEAGTDGLGGVGRFLYNICRARNTYYRWYQKRALRSLRKDGLAKEVDSAIDVVGSLRSPALGWTILRTMQPYLDHPEFYAKFADAAKKYENAPHIAWFVRHERARALFKANKPEEASKLYGELLTKTLKAGFNPGIDKELRQQFIKHRGQRNWSDMCRQTAGKLIDGELLRTAITLSKQLRDLGDIDTANSIFEKTIAKLEPKERPDVAMIAIQRLRELKQDDEADKLLSGMLENPWVATSAKLWRYGSSLAEARGKTAEALRRLERAVTIEFVTRPDVINLQEIRTKYTALLQKYEQIADASATLEQEPPNDLVARIVRTADQWRSMEDDETLVCQLAHRILNKLGQHDLAWDFATTPLGTQPGSSSWRSLGQHLGRQKEIDRAANAYVKAFQFEQTNPEILWEHATLLRINGRESDSMPLIKRIAEGKWQPRFNAVKQTAATLLEM